MHITKREDIQSELRYRSLFERYPIGLVLSRVDTGEILDCNAYFATMLAYPTRESCLAEYKSSKHYVRLDDRTRMVKTLQDNGSVENFKVELQDQKGERLWVSYSARIVDGILEGAVVVITDQKKAERQLQESEERYRRLANAAHEAVVITRKGIIVEITCQLEQMYGYTREEILDAGVKMFIHPDDRELVMEHIRNNDRGPYRHRGLKKDGSVIYLEIRADTILIDGEEHRLTVIRDITELVTVQEQLFQSEKMRAIGQLAGGIAHDFNNQLGGIVGYAELLRDELTENQKTVHYVDNILRAAKRASDLTSQLLAFARKGKYIAVPTDIHHAVAEVVGILARTIDKNILIKQHLDAQLPTVIGDPTQLQNAILNIALNARDAMPNGGEFVIETSIVAVERDTFKNSLFDLIPGPYVKISLKDTGIGMDAATLKRIFEPFFTTKAQGRGIGMGLASVYGTIRNHGGAIEVESTPRLGTVMTLFLPHVPQQIFIDPPTDPSFRAFGKDIRILLVDDEEMVISSAAAILKTQGIHVTLSLNGEQALAAFREPNAFFDLVLLDIIMPVMSGKETFRELKKLDPNVRVLLCSGYSVEGDAQELLDEGAVDFIQKPYRKSELLGKIRSVLQAKAKFGCPEIGS
jgi:PAS domain S-box-containing protein